MSMNDREALMIAVTNLADADFDELQAELGQPEYFNEQPVIVCVSHCATEA